MCERAERKPVRQFLARWAMTRTEREDLLGCGWEIDPDTADEGPPYLLLRPLVDED